MKYTLFTALAAAFTSFANAYTTPVGANPEGNPIDKPGLSEIVPAGSPYTISWTPTSMGTVTLVLLRGPGKNIIPMYPIVEKIENTGSYTWTPATDLEADVTHYGIQLIDDATGKYQYTSQFGISNPNPVSSSSSPSTASDAPTGSPSSIGLLSVPTTTKQTTSPIPYPTGGLVTSGTLVYSTSMVTTTSCGPKVTHCPGKNYTAPASVPASVPASTPVVWTSPAWNGTVAPTSYPKPSVPVVVPSVNVSKPSPSAPVVPISPGAGDKIRVGGVMAVVMVAGLALLL